MVYNRIWKKPRLSVFWDFGIADKRLGYVSIYEWGTRDSERLWLPE